MKCNWVNLPAVLEMIMKVLDCGSDYFKVLSHNCPERKNPQNTSVHLLSSPKIQTYDPFNIKLLCCHNAATL
jgi:hypothetical protein